MIFHACAKRGGALSRYILNVEIFVTSHAHEPRAAFVERRCGAPVRDARVVLNEALEHAEQVEQVARVPEQSTMRNKTFLAGSKCCFMCSVSVTGALGIHDLRSVNRQVACRP